MTAKDCILGSYKMSEMIVDRYLSDLDDKDILARPLPGQNHIAWQLGHLLLSERGMVESVKPGASPALPAGFEEAHGRDDASTHSDDASRFLKKDQYIALMKAQRDATTATLSALTDQELDAPSAERFAKMAPTAGSVLGLVGNHVLMHVGQFVSVRRKLGKPIVI